MLKQPGPPAAPAVPPTLDLTGLGGWHDSSQELRQGLFVLEMDEEAQPLLAWPPAPALH